MNNMVKIINLISIIAQQMHQLMFNNPQVEHYVVEQLCIIKWMIVHIS